MNQKLKVLDDDPLGRGLNRRGPFVLLVLGLIVVGLSAATFRHELYNIPWFVGEQTQLWQIDARVEFNATGESSVVQLALPPEQNGFTLLSESSASSGWGFSIDNLPSQRLARWTQRSPQGAHTLFYKLAIAESNHQITQQPPSAATPAIWDEPYQTAVNQVLSTIYPLSADAHSLTTQLIQTLQQSPLDQNVSLLLSQYSSTELLSRTLNTALVPARIVQVLELEDGRRRQSLSEYLQVWDGQQWVLYHPQQGRVQQQQNLLIWQMLSPAVLEVLGGQNSSVSFSVLRVFQSSTILAQENAGDIALSLYSLPIAEQSMFKLIMLLPVGAFVVAVLRILVGLKTSGTFMPVLIALAFLQTELIPGLVSFVSVVALGLFIRSYLSSLNLLLVARIATLVVLVIGIISIFSILSYRLGLIQGLTITFFPMIILAWTIERMSITWEEEGAREVFLQGGGSLFVAVLAYLIMSQPQVEHLVFHFPELHLSLLGLILLLGRYTGYRLLELRRFATFKSS